LVIVLTCSEIVFTNSKICSSPGNVCLGCMHCVIWRMSENQSNNRNSHNIGTIFKKVWRVFVFFRFYCCHSSVYWYFSIVDFLYVDELLCVPCVVQLYKFTCDLHVDLVVLVCRALWSVWSISSVVILNISCTVMFFIVILSSFNLL